MSLRFEKNTGRIELDKLVNGQALKLGVSGVTIAGSDRDPPSSSSINTTTASNPALNTTQSNPNLLFGSQPPPPSTSMKKKGGGSTANMLTTPTDHNNSASIITPPITKVLVGDAWESRQVSSLKFVQAAWRIMFSNRVNKWIKSMKACKWLRGLCSFLQLN